MRRTKVHVSFFFFFNFWLVRSPELCSAAQPNSSLVSFIRLKPRIYLAEKFEQLNRCETQLNSNELNSEEITKDSWVQRKQNSSFFLISKLAFIYRLISMEISDLGASYVLVKAIVVVKPVRFNILSVINNRNILPTRKRELGASIAR